ncbi:hypothetical protein G6F43_008584 [Rhizopus delemar]|nr:hypothetical protein G6F43_008584 [Rhizopus delemar]
MLLSNENNFNQKSGLSESPRLNNKAISISKTSTQQSWARVVTKNRKSLLHLTNSSSTANMVTSTPSTLDVSVISKTMNAWRMVLLLQINQLSYLVERLTLTCKLSACVCPTYPFLNEKIMMKGLEKSLRKYGGILDVGILLEPATGTYTCTGYAVLNVASKTETFESLTHLIPWDEQWECSFYAVWNQMPVPDPIDDDAVEDLLSTLPYSLCLSASDQRFLVNSFTCYALLNGVSRCPKRSSPGLDGLPYEILRLIFIHPSCRDLLLQVYNDALSKGVFPNSRFGTSVSLLPKKGDLKDLKNWRPISLINTDAKVFTRLLNARIVKCASKLINPYQTGFLGGRFIADNGLLVKLIIEHARLTSSAAIGLLLDQEKAYDRVHPTYLCQVLHRFGFPSSIVNSLSTLFFNTNLHLNINGFLSSPVPQRRGLRQGDPISPVLFNLAFEPLLRRILSSPHVSGFQIPRSVCSPPNLESRSKVKMLAYADDVVCFLNDPHEFNILHEHLNLYAKASNAKVNFNKTEAVSLSGSRLCYQRIWRTPLLQQQIHSWHDSSSREPVIYLGFPLHSSIAQRDTYLTSLLSKITTGMQLHSHRSLSVRGRVTILNSLILSKLWHVLRILSVSKLFFKKLKSQISGWIGVLNPHIQQSALQLRWLLPLLHDRPCSPTSDFWNHRSLQSSVVLPLLVDHLLRHSLPVGSQVPIHLDYRQAFVFPSLRPKALTQSSDGVFSLFFTAVDNLPHLFEKVVINSQTALCLQLGDVSVFSSSCPLPKSIAQLPCSLAYKFDPTKGRLQPKLPVEISIHPYLTKRFLKWVRLDQLKLQPFFIRAFLRPDSSFIPVTHSLVDMSPFLVTMYLVDHPGVRLRLTSRRYRHLCCPSESSSLYPNLTSSKWLALWRFPLRPQSQETPSHFLLECPRKLAVWSSLWVSQFEQPFSTYSLRCALFLLQFPTCRPTAIQGPSNFFGSILLAVWRNYWSSIFDQLPFTTSATISSANQLLSASLQELLISDGISPVPLPHLILPCYSSRRRSHTDTGDHSFN